MESKYNNLTMSSAKWRPFCLGFDVYPNQWLCGSDLIHTKARWGLFAQFSIKVMKGHAINCSQSFSDVSRGGIVITRSNITVYCIQHTTDRTPRNAPDPSHSRTPYGLFTGCFGQNRMSTHGAHTCTVRRRANFTFLYVALRVLMHAL